MGTRSRGDWDCGGLRRGLGFWGILGLLMASGHGQSVGGDEGGGGVGRRGVHWAVKAGVLVYGFLVLTRTMPVPEAEVYARVDSGQVAGLQAAQERLLVANMRTVRSPDFPVHLIQETTGLWQYWDMFAPNPARIDFYLDAVVRYSDGSEAVVAYPRMRGMGVAQKYVYERYRKYSERLSDNEAWKWPDTAYWFALRGWSEEGNPPVKVVLRRHFREVQPIGTPQLSEYTTAAFYEALIDAEQLARLRETGSRRGVAGP